VNDDTQITLFPDDELPRHEARSGPPLAADASIQAALGLFEQHMREEGFAANTIKAFTSDIRLLGKYLGIGQPVGDIGTKNLNDFLYWLAYERGIPCSLKSYARRVTTLKVFFGWLQEAGVLVIDPAAAVVQSSVSSPLPNVPTDDDVAAALAVSQAWREGVERKKPDARPHLLLTLLLTTAIKKGETMAIVPNHIDDADPDEPFLFVRYKNPRLRYKERKLPLDPGWLKVLDEYIEQYRPTDTLFTCTARNLEYVLNDVTTEAGLPKGLFTFETLRWVSAMRDLRRGVEPDDVRQKLGLSKITWRDTKAKLERLIQRERERAASQ
jgi:integrase/recombinase XerD